MNVQYLDCDELDIECQIRNIFGSISNRITLLTQALEREKSGETECPKEPHFLAARYPKREVEACANKLKQNREGMEVFMQACDTMDSEKLEELATGVEHISGRLNRIILTKGGPIVTSARKLLESCAKMLGCFGDLRSKQSSIPDVEKSLKELVIDFHEGGEDDEHHNEQDDSHSNIVTPPHTIASPIDNKYLDQRQLDAVVDALMNRLNLPAANAIKTNRDLQVDNLPKKPGLHSSTILSPTPAQVYPEFNAALPPPNYNLGRVRAGENLPKAATIQSNNFGNETHFGRSTRLEIHRWAISFSGECGEIPVERFFYRVESMATSNGISIESLVRNLNVLLNGKAREWYWMFMERTRNVNWEELKCAMIHRFQDRRTDSEIRLVLERRKQRVKEAFLDFYNDILLMALPLKTQMSDEETINLLLRNVRPGLQSAFAGQTFLDISILFNKAVAIEDTWSRLGWIPELVYMAPRRQVSELRGGPDYCEMIPNQVNLAESSNEYDSVCAMALPNLSSSNSDNTRNRKTCWNCGNISHFFKDCTIPIAHKFCFGCGAKNVIKINCQTCRNVAASGNYQRSIRNFGDLRLQRQPAHVPKPEMVDAVSNTDPEFYSLLRRTQD